MRTAATIGSLTFRAVTLLIPAALGCRGATATVTMAEIPTSYRVSEISASGARLESRFSLRSDDTRSPRVQKVAASVFLSGTLLGRFELLEEFQMAARSTSSALMRGWVDFKRVTPAVYRSFFDAEVPYALSGETRLAYKGLRRAHSIEGTGRLPPPRRLFVTFTDDSAMQLVRLDSARLDATPSDESPVGVALSLTVTNPMAFTVRVSSAGYNFRVRGNTFLAGQSSHPFDLNPGPNRFEFKTVIKPVRGVTDLAHRFASGRDLGISVSGQMTLEESGRLVTVMGNKQ